jgi:hypothetical protein
VGNVVKEDAKDRKLEELFVGPPAVMMLQEASKFGSELEETGRFVGIVGKVGEADSEKAVEDRVGEGEVVDERLEAVAEAVVPILVGFELEDQVHQGANQVVG